MEIVEAILKYFTDNSATLINIMLPILITFFVTMFFRKKDKKDNDARNLRAELREYFLTNIKPTINEIVKDQDQTYKKYVNLVDKKYAPRDIKKLQECFKHQFDLVCKMHEIVIPLFTFTEKTAHKEYEKRFKNYYNISIYIQILYEKLIFPQIMDSKVLYESKTLNQQQKKDLLHLIVNLIKNIDFILAESELTLFNHNFENDKINFEKQIEILNACVLNTGLDPNKKIVCSVEEFEKNLLKKFGIPQK